MSTSGTEVFIAVIGAGGVGSCFLRQLAQLAEKRQSPRLRLCYVAIIDKALYYAVDTPIDTNNALNVLESDGSDLPCIPDTIDYLSSAPGKVVVVDNTISNVLAEAYPSFLKKGLSIITPNKKAFSGSYELWQDIISFASSSGSLVYHESSVGAGMPIISTLNDLVQTGDEITRIEGVFSGSMSFLFNSFSPISGKGGKWSAEVRKAKELGYTEPDPRQDLNGVDAARKLTILGRLAGMAIESPLSFPVRSLIPTALEDIETVEEFMERLPQFDDQMEDVRKEAEKNNKVLRFIGSVDVMSGKAKVDLEQFDRSHPFAGLQGSDNIISFHTKRYGKLPLTIRGAGAGGDVTAMGVLSDLLKILCQK